MTYQYADHYRNLADRDMTTAIHLFQLLLIYLQVLSVCLALLEHCSGTLRDLMVCVLPLVQILDFTQESYKLWIYVSCVNVMCEHVHVDEQN